MPGEHSSSKYETNVIPTVQSHKKALFEGLDYHTITQKVGRHRERNKHCINKANHKYSLHLIMFQMLSIHKIRGREHNNDHTIYDKWILRVTDFHLLT